MKITIFALHLNFGGVERYVSTLANTLCEDHDVEIIVTYKMCIEPFFPIDQRVKIKYLLSVVPNTKEFKEAIRTLNPFKIIKEGFKSFYVLNQRKRMNKQAIQNCKSDVIISTRIFHNRLISKYADSKTIKIATEHNHHNNDQKYITSLKRSCFKFDYLIPISQELTEFYRKSFSNLDINILHIPFTIDIPENFIPHTNDSDIISVGRLSKEKGSVELIELFKLIHEKDESIRLHIVGSGSEEENVKHKIREYSLEESVIMHGHLSQPQIDELYQSCAIYVMTSFTESFGLVLLEAMACSLPCIAFSSAQGACEIIQSGSNGYLINKRNMEEMTAKIIELLNDNSERNNIAKQAFTGLSKYRNENYRYSWNSLLMAIKKQR